ncbi:MAG: hypothetical protein U1F51_14510 [Burkholderiales bacterium]
MDPSAPPPLQYEIDPNRERVTLTIGTQTLQASAVELERLVQFLGMVRSAMIPEVEADVPKTPFLQIEAPRVAVMPTRDRAWTGLVLRTAPYGWIGFNLDRTQTADLAQHLAKLAQAMTPPAT